ncbi:hypothetical protein Tco_1147899 [Tanacetum coccineum]
MTTLQFVDTHNLVAVLAKPTESDGFEQIVDNLNAHTIKYALTLQALVDGKKIIVTEASIRCDLQLDDEEAQKEIGEGSAKPADPYHTPIITQPSSSQPQRKQKSRRPKRKDTEIPQYSVPSNPTNVVDEAINEEPSMKL